MQQFKKYEELQNMLLTMEKEKDIEEVFNFIAENELMTDQKNASSTLILISSVAFSRYNLYNNIILLLKQIPKIINIFNKFHFRSDRDIRYRFYYLCILLINSNHIPKKFLNDQNDYYSKKVRKIKTDNDTELYEIIQKDDVEALQDILSRNSIKFDNIFKFKTFKSITLLECSALMGSIKCFKLLWMITKPHDFDELLKCSIVGGNFDIIHIVENEIDFDISKNKDILYEAILYMQNDLIEYIVDTYNIEIDTECYIKCIYASNYTAFTKLLEIDQSRSITTYGKIGSTPLDIASFEGNSIFFEYLYFLDNNSISLLNIYGKNVLQSATKNYQLDIIEFIIYRNLINPYEICGDYFTPYEMAEYYFHKETGDYLKKIFSQTIFKNKMDWDFEDYYFTQDEKYYIDKKIWLARKYDHDKTRKHYSTNKKGNKTKHNIKYSWKRICNDN